MAIVMSNDEEKSVILKILSLYIITTMIFLGIFFGAYYNRSYGLILHERSNELREVYEDLIRTLDKNHSINQHTLSELLNVNPNLHVMILDKNKVPVYNNLNMVLPEKYLNKKNGIYVFDGYVFIDSKPPKHRKIHKKNLSRSDLFSQYQVIIRGSNITSDIWWLRVKMIGFLLLSLLSVGVIAYFLLKFSLKPYKNKISFLNRFIKDTTHEINTPISVILMSIERIEKEEISESNLKKINRIHIAAKTLASIYRNIAFYSVAQQKDKSICVDVKELLEQRLEFFDPLFVQKNLNIRTSFAPSFINATIDEMGCVIDNLLSNAIKYNKKNGEIQINLEPNKLSIKDTGCGIYEENMKNIFERYIRYNHSQGGFGIGLALVKELCDRYGVAIKCESKVGEGSLFVLEWKKIPSSKIL